MNSSYASTYQIWENDQRKWLKEFEEWDSLKKSAQKEGNSYWEKIYGDQAASCKKGIVGFEI